MKKFNQRFFLIINVILICLFIQSSWLPLYATGDNVSQGHSRLNDLVDEESNSYDLPQDKRYNLRSRKQRTQSFLKKKYSNKNEEKFTRKQVLCIFFCVLIIGGAILAPMITPFFYLFGNAGERNDGTEDLFDKALIPATYSNSYSEHLINLGSESSLSISDAVCHNGAVDMCCIVRNNELLRCCYRKRCHEISFSAAPENSYLIDDNKILLMKSDQETRAYTPQEQSFKIYESLMKLNEHCNRGLLGEIAKQEASKKFINLLNEIKDKMPGLDKRQIALGYFCQDGSIVRINEEVPGKESFIKKDLRNVREELIAASYSKNITSSECKFGSDCALAVIGIDYNKFVKVKLTDDEIERILAHELGHLIQQNNIFLEYDSTSNFDEYIHENIEIDADLKSQLAVDSNDLNFDTAAVLIQIDSLLSNSFIEPFLLDSSFSCFALVNQAGNAQFSLHPDNRCRIAFVLSLSEAMQKMNYFFKQRI